MPIEFTCAQCGKQLRTADDTAGRQAKCPQCGAVMEIPRFSNPAPLTPLPLQPASPFAPSPPPDAQQGWNPYESPTIGGQTASFAEAAHGEIVPRRVDFNEAIGATWRIFRDRMGVCILCGLVVFVMYVAMIVFAGIGGMILGTFQDPQAAPVPNGPQFIAPPIDPVAELLGNLIGWIAGAWIQAGATLCFLKIARGEHASAADTFAGTPYFSRGLVIGGIYAVVAVAGSLSGFVVKDPIAGGLVDIGAGIVSFALYLFLGLAWPFVVDRNLSFGEALTKSIEFMQGNKLTLFLVYLVCGLGGLLFCVVTCGIGFLFYFPFIHLLSAVFYLQATGQRTAEVRAATL